ncbi:UNVERIFIED_CONTAM: Transcription initiation factor TFIID subunit [Sesamum angustifolium]|uniref:Transcription initiation factor TFIID subunit n=1 Tax=Sesamum angustifolium TaxID=2727405 RepID=A0AAW2QN35_9LAMI
MEEQFILRVPPAVAERIERLLNDSASSSEDKSLDLLFSEDGRTGTFVIGSDRFSASLLDLPTVVESYKTYDDNVLIKTADIGQLIKLWYGISTYRLVADDNGQGGGDGVPEAVEYRHGLTPPMRDARRRRFRREPDLNPEVVGRVEKDLQNIMAVEQLRILISFYLVNTLSLFVCFSLFLTCNCEYLQVLLDYYPRIEMAEPEDYGDENARSASKKVVATPSAKQDVPEAGPVGGEPDGSDSEESDDSI